MPKTRFRAHLLQIESMNARGAIFLNDKIFTIGRHPNNSLVLDSPLISRFHATIVRSEPQKGQLASYWIIDGGWKRGERSSNGFLVNGNPSCASELRDGDTIVFPDGTILKYQFLLSTKPTGNVTNSFLNNLIERKISSEPDLTEIELVGHGEEIERPCLSRLAILLESCPYPVFELDEFGDLIYKNRATREAFPDLWILKKEHPLIANLQDILNGLAEDSFIREVTIDGRVFEQHVYRVSGGKALRNFLFEISRRKQMEKDLYYRASHDLTTALPNRDYFTRQLSTSLEQMREERKSLAFIFLDLDRFKLVNDTLGHEIGDLVLKYFAERLRACLRQGDLVARWGGDEFVIALKGVHNNEEILGVVERILEHCERPFEVDGERLRLSCSIGIAIYPKNGLDGETLLKNADLAMYHSKKREETRYSFYQKEMSSQAIATISIENRLHQALEEGEFFTVYQPVVNVVVGKVSGMEALLRWRHPSIGMIPPNEFIPRAEENGAIVPIGAWVTRDACFQHRLWLNSGLLDGHISINISPRQFQQPDLVDTIARILEETGLTPRDLELELTETMLLGDDSQIYEALSRLKDLGVCLALDDFGAGYSSLRYIKNFSFDTLKLDRSLILGIHQEARNVAIISTLLDLGRKLDLKIVAEGVETSEQAAILQNLGCENIQGFLISPPLLAEEASSFLATRRDKGGY